MERVRVFGVVLVCVFGGLALPAKATITSDFEDGTLQGWTKGSPFYGTLTISSSGNPGFCMEATDTKPQGGGLRALAPIEFTGDLSVFPGISWDEFVPDRGSYTTCRTTVFLLSSNGTSYYGAYTPSQHPKGIWHSRSLSFESSNWILETGTESFETVIHNVQSLFVQMDTSTYADGRIESRVDNITLIPEPATMSLLALGGVRLLRRKK